jgi:hypothetical protein
MVSGSLNVMEILPLLSGITGAPALIPSSKTPARPPPG